MALLYTEHGVPIKNIVKKCPKRSNQASIDIEAIPNLCD